MIDDEQLIHDVVVEVLDLEEVSPKSCAKPNTFYHVPTGIYIYDDSSYSMDFFDPLINLNHTIQVVKKLKEKMLDISIFWTSDVKWGSNMWEVEICNPELRSKRCYESGDDRISYVEDSLLGKAICLAALEAVRSIK